MVDYPGKVASVIYTYGCNFRCPYCYNIELVLPEYYRDLPDLSEDEVIEKLRSRGNFIQGVVITGGEPTIWEKRLLFFIERLKFDVALPVKLDTNGSNPKFLKLLLDEKLVDFIALDLKTSPERYREIGGNFDRIKETLDILQNHKQMVEIRLTLYPGLIDEEDLKMLLPYLKPFQKIALQRYIPEKNLSGKPLTPYTYEKHEALFFIIRDFLPEEFILKRY